MAIAGFLFLVAQLVFGGELYTLTHDSSFVFAPLALGLISFWVAFWRGMAKGPWHVRLAVLLGLGSLIALGSLILTPPPPDRRCPMWLDH